MKILNKTYIIGLSLLAAGFWSCEDEVVKTDYEAPVTPVESTVATYSVTEVGANYVIIEGSSGVMEYSEAVLAISSNENLAGAMQYPLEEESEFSFRISGLVPATDYYFAVIEADSLMVRALGEKKTFSTEDGVIAFSVDYATTSKAAWQSAFSSIDKDGDGNDWYLIEYPTETSPTFAFRSNSWAGSALTPENYLLFPEIDFDGVQGSLAFQIVAATSYYAEAVRVVASSEPITEENCRDAEVLFTHTLGSTAVYYGSVDIPASYEGKPLYLALVHTDVSDMEAIYFLGATFIYK